MDPSSKSPRQYMAHRESQRERILEAAERLFIAGGIDRVSLSEIARAAQLTRHTVYAYFPDKQEVAWAILQQIFEQGRVGAPAAPAGNGYQRCEQFMLQMVERLEQAPEHMRFIVEFNTLYAREASAGRMRALTGRGGAEGQDPFTGFVRQGIADGSIRAEVDPELCSAAAWNLLSGMNSRFALLGDVIAAEYNRPVKTIYQEICRRFLEGMKNTSCVKSDG